MVKFAHLDGAFFEVFKLQASPWGRQSLQQKEKKRGKKEKRQKKEIKKLQKPNLERRKSLSRPKILISTHAWAKMS